MVGNKCDLSREKRVVSTEEGEIRAKELGMSFVETSAKTGTNIKSLFLRITSEIYLNASGKPSPPNAFIANVDISKGSSSADRKSSGEPGGSCC
jgi:GTPase SAR1 family protein